MPAAFRLYSKMDTQLGDAGQLLPGGSLKFYLAGTTTPKDVFGELALTTNNGSTVTLSASSRPLVDVWGSGSYFVELYDVDGVKQGEADNVQIPGGEATALPALVDGEFLTSDGAVMSWADILQVPDPTGNTGKYLSTDGSLPTWVTGPATPTVPDLPITVTTGGVILGTAGSNFVQLLYGASTITGSGSLSASKSITFSSAYNATPNVVVTPTGSAPTNAGDIYPALLGHGAVQHGLHRRVQHQDGRHLGG
jgi:hypothetical protein